MTQTKMVEIIVGSMLGASEYVAESLQEVLHQEGYQTRLHLQPVFSDIPKEGIWLLCSSTHGAGDYPDNIEQFAKCLVDQDLSKIRYLTVALGDTSYDTFCAAGKNLDTLMRKGNATPMADVYCIDVLEHTIPEEVAAPWLQNLIKESSLATG